MGTALAGTVLLGSGCVERRVVYVRQPAPPPPAGGEVVVTEAPPAPQVEVVGIAPGPEFVWMPGAWEWRGRWFWVGGRWAAGPHPGALWVQGRWIRHGHGHVWVRGYWR